MTKQDERTRGPGRRLGDKESRVERIKEVSRDIESRMSVRDKDKDFFVFSKFIESKNVYNERISHVFRIFLQAMLFLLSDLSLYSFPILS
jgi:hypothetical protein